MAEITELRENDFCPPSYWDPTNSYLDVGAFINDIQPESQEPEELSKACDLVIESTSSISMGSTGNENIEKCRRFLADQELHIEDSFGAYPICIMKTLKMFAALLKSSNSYESINKDKVNIFSQLVESLVIDSEESYLRDRHMDSLGNKKSLDQILTEQGAGKNLTRKLRKDEIGMIVLPTVAILFHRYLKDAKETFNN